MKDIQVGQRVTLRARARDRETGEIVIPGELSCEITGPAGEKFVLGVALVDEEWFEAAFTVEMPGAYIAAWQGHGIYETRGEMKFYVAQPLG